MTVTTMPESTSYTFRVLHENGWYELPSFVKAEPGFEFSDVSGLQLEYPKNGTNVEHLVEDSIVVMLVDGVELKNSRWVIQSLDGDDNPMKSSFTAKGRSVPSAFEKVVVLPTPEQPGEDIRFDTATPGGVIDNLFSAAQARGALTGISWLGDNAVDAHGEAWAKVISLTYRLGVQYLSAVRNLVDQGLLEWQFQGFTMELYNADSMGVDHTLDAADPIVFSASRDYTEVPFTSSTASRASYAAVLGDDNKLVEVTNPGVEGPFGREEISLSQGGTKDEDTLLQVGQSKLELGAQIRYQYTRKIDLTQCRWQPLRDFNVSDYIYEQNRGKTTRYRIRSMVLTINQDGVKDCSVVLNDKFLEREIAIARKVDGILGGATNDGGGNGLPAENTPDTTTPNPPTGLTVSSTAYANVEGVAKAAVDVDWNAPTNNTDNSVISDLRDYEVQYKLSSSSLWASTATTNTQIRLNNLDPDVDIDVRVRARDNSTHMSEWVTASHHTEVDNLPPPVPSQPSATPLFGAIAVGWDGKGSAGEAMPPDFRATEVHISTTNDFEPDATSLVAVFPYPNGGKHLASDLEYGTTYYFKLVAVDRLGNRSAASAQGSSVPIRLVGDDLEPNSITTGQVDFDARDLGANKTFRGPTEPTGAIDGDFWVDTSPTDHDTLKRLTTGVWEPVDDSRIADIILENEQQAQSIQEAYDQSTSAYNAAQQAQTDATNAATQAGDALTQVGILEDDLDQKVEVFWQSTAPTGRTETDVNDIWIDTDDGKTYLWTWDSVAGTGSWAQSEDQRIGQALTSANNAENKVGTKVSIFFQDSAPSTTGRTQGDVWYETDNQNKPYHWDGTQWAAYQLGAPAISATARQLGAITTYYQASQPASGMLAGDFWVDTDDNRKLYRYSGTAWEAADDTRIVDAINAAAGAQAAADGKVRTFAQDTAPTGMVAEDVGDLWVDTANNNILKRWSGSAWIAVDDERIAVLVQEMADAQADIAAALQAAADAQATADGKMTVYYQTSPPSTTAAEIGDLWIDEDSTPANEMFRLSAGLVWESVQDEAIQEALTNAQTAQTTADGKIVSYWQASAPGGTHALGDLWFDTDDDNKPSWWNGSGWAAIPLGANAIKPGSLTLGNLVSEVRASLGQVFYDDFSDTSRWEPVARLGTFTSVAAADARSGSNVGRFTGDTNAYRAHKTLVPYDPGQLYRITVRVRENTASSAARFYAGVLGIAADGVTKVNIIGQDSTSSQFYCAAAGEDVGGAWVEYVGYIKGTADPGESGKSADPKAPRHLHDSVRYIRPLMIFNYAGVAADVMEVDMFKLEAVPVGLVERTNIALAAINSALIEDLAVVSAKIGNLAVTTAKIADLAVTSAKIQSLVASKIVTGELSAGVAIYAGSATGNHARMTDQGFFVGGPNAEGVVQDAVRMGTSTGDRFAIPDPEDPTGEATLASISDQGQISGQELNIVGDPVFGGTSLSEKLWNMPWGLVCIAEKPGSEVAGTTSTKLGLISTGFTIQPGRAYRIRFDGVVLRADAANMEIGARVVAEYGNPAPAPSVNSSLVLAAIGNNHDQNRWVEMSADGIWFGGGVTVPTECRLLLVMTATTAFGGTVTCIGTNYPQIAVEDIGPTVWFSGTVDRGGGSSPPPVREYTSEWVATESESYRGDGSARTDTTDLVQGYNSYNGNGHALARFTGGAVSGETGKTMASALSGASIKKAEVYVYFTHWYYNAGGTAILRPLFSSFLNSATPSGTYIASSGWPKPGGRWVDVTSLFAANTNSLWLGKGPSSDLTYYGRADGGSPRYRVTYTR